MPEEPDGGRTVVGTISRTLLAFGSDLSGAQNQPRHTEVRVALPTALGVCASL